MAKPTWIATMKCVACIVQYYQPCSIFRGIEMSSSMSPKTLVGSKCEKNPLRRQKQFPKKKKESLSESSENYAFGIIYDYLLASFSAQKFKNKLSSLWIESSPKSETFWVFSKTVPVFQSHQAPIVEHALNVINDLFGFLDSLPRRSDKWNSVSKLQFFFGPPKKVNHQSSKFLITAMVFWSYVLFFCSLCFLVGQEKSIHA